MKNNRDEKLKLILSKKFLDWNSLIAQGGLSRIQLMVDQGDLSYEEKLGKGSAPHKNDLLAC